MSGIFEADVFAGPRRGMYGGFAGMGALPAGADRISATLSRWRGQFPTLPPNEVLTGKGATHYTTRVVSSGVQEFTFYNSAGNVAVGPLQVWHRLAERPVEPAATREPAATPVARREGDGLLPSATAEASQGEPRWLPWLLVGGGVLVAGGIVYASTRKPVAANRHRRRRRRRR
jgi:hypothetical protein